MPLFLVAGFGSVCQGFLRNFDSSFDSKVETGSYVLQMEQLQAELLSSGQALGAGVQLLLLLTKFRFGLAGEDFELLRASLSPAVLEGAEVSL
jgi:hypothetical protein